MTSSGRTRSPRSSWRGGSAWKRKRRGAGHKPLSPHAWCVEMDGGQIVCFARQGCAELRRRYPEWVVYSFEDAACILKQHFSEAFFAEGV